MNGYGLLLHLFESQLSATEVKSQKSKYRKLEAKAKSWIQSGKVAGEL